eukprot:Hpha_TRINITY_DN1697_c0_g1::TRINITY_DN1697_c0_g1_i1::g.48691::m.48691
MAGCPGVMPVPAAGRSGRSRAEPSWRLLQRRPCPLFGLATMVLMLGAMFSHYPSPWARRELRIAVLSYEFVPPLFSGNGVYARTLVKGLLRPEFSGVVKQVTVLAGCPEGADGCADGDEDFQEHTKSGRLTVKRVSVDPSLWRRLDRGSGWAAFKTGASAVLGDISFDVAMLVDWHSVAAFDAAVHSGIVSAPCVALSFRCYYASPGLADDARDATFYASQEKEGLPVMGHCGSALALTDLDRDLLSALCRGSPEEQRQCRESIGVLPPALRPDVASVAQRRGAGDASTWAAGRKYLVSCIRLSPEKRADIFVDAVAMLGASFFAEHGVTPFLCGAHANVTYANRIVSKLREAVPSTIVEPNFLGSERLAEIFGASLLNIHSPLYDAYGMTVVEAASFGAPTLLHDPKKRSSERPLDAEGPAGEGVGAVVLLSPEKGMALTGDFTDPAEVAQEIRRLLLPESRRRLAEVGLRARERAIGWTDEKATTKLLASLQREAAHKRRRR